MASSAQTLVDRILNPTAVPPPADIEELVGKVLGNPTAELVGQRDLGEPGLGNLFTRFRMATGDTFPEKLKAFKQSFPEGELSQDPVDQTLLFKKDPSQPFAKVDADLLEGGGMEVLGDVADILGGDVGPVLGEIASAVNTKGLSLVGVLSRMAFGAGAGEVAGEAVQSLTGMRDPESDPLENVLKRAGGEAVFSAAGGAVGEKLLRPVANLIRGAGVVGTRPGAVRAMQATERLTGKTLPVNVVADNPIIRKLGGQSGAVVPTINRYLLEIEQGTRAALDTSIGKLKQGRRPALEAIAKAEKSERQRILNFSTTNRRTIKESGDATKNDIARYDIESNGRVNLAYENARSIEEPDLDLLDTVSTAVEVKALADKLGPEGASVSRLAQNFIDLASAGADPVKLRQLAADPDLADLAKQVAGTDPLRPRTQTINLPNGEVKEITPFDQLKFMRSQAFDLKTPGSGEISRAPQKLAARLFGASTNAMLNPKNSNPRFLTAYKKANRLAKSRFTTREQIITIDAAKTQNPAALADRLTDLRNVDNVDNLALMRRVMKTGEFAKLQDARISRMLDNPFTITKTMSEAHPEVLRKLMTPKQIAEVKFIGKKFDALGQTGLADALAKQNTVRSVVSDIVSGANNVPIKTLTDIMFRNGGRDSNFGKALRAGLMEDITSKSLGASDGVETIVSDKLRSEIRKHQASGAIKLLTSGDRQILSDVRLVNKFIEAASDTGASLQAGEAVAQARSLTDNAIRTIVENIGVGKLMTLKSVQAFLTGTGRKQKLSRSTTLRLLGAMAATLVTDANDKTIENGIQDLQNTFQNNQNP